MAQIEVGATELVRLDNVQFKHVWFVMKDEQKAGLPDGVRRQCVDRYRKLTSYIDSGIKRFEHEQQRAAKETKDEFAEATTAREIMASASAPTQYCVDGRVPCGVVIIGARPKARKSWYALQLGTAKATAGKFMGVETPGGRVLYIALEDNRRRMRKRFEFFGITPDTAPDNLHIFHEWPSGVAGIEKLERWLAKFPDTVLIIIDVLQRFRGARDAKASAYEGDYTMMATLHGVTQRHDGLTILVVHHVRKGPVDDPVEAINGTFAIAGAADAYIILRRGEGQQWIAHIDGRDWESWDHEFAWEFVDREGWRQIGVSAGDQLTATQQEIIRFARDNDYTTPTKLAEFRQISKPTAHEALRALVSKGAMRVYSGKYYANEQVS